MGGQEQVTIAATRIADAEGRAAVSLRRVRWELGMGSLLFAAELRRLIEGL